MIKKQTHTTIPSVLYQTYKLIKRLPVAILIAIAANITIFISTKWLSQALFAQYLMQHESPGFWGLTIGRLGTTILPLIATTAIQTVWYYVIMSRLQHRPIFSRSRIIYMMKCIPTILGIALILKATHFLIYIPFVLYTPFSIPRDIMNVINYGVFGLIYAYFFIYPLLVLEEKYNVWGALVTSYHRVAQYRIQFFMLYLIPASLIWGLYSISPAYLYITYALPIVSYGYYFGILPIIVSVYYTVSRAGISNPQDAE